MIELNDLPMTRQHKNMLFDFYGLLLTERQREIYVMHHHDDCSLAEIGDSMGVTPQAVADMLKRADAKLNRYEEKLGLVQKFHSQQEVLAETEGTLTELAKLPGASEKAAAIRKAIAKMSL